VVKTLGVRSFKKDVLFSRLVENAIEKERTASIWGGSRGKTDAQWAGDLLTTKEKHKNNEGKKENEDQTT